MSRIATLKDIGKVMKDIFLSNNEYYTYDDEDVEWTAEQKELIAKSEKVVKSYEKKYSGLPNNGGKRRKKGSLGDVKSVEAKPIKTEKSNAKNLGEKERE